MRTRQDNDVVIIWEKDKGHDVEAHNIISSWTTRRWVALEARGRRIMLCDAFKKQLLVSRVREVKWDRNGYRLHHEPYRRISKARSSRYWKYMRREMVYGGARIMRLPKGLL